MESLEEKAEYRYITKYLRGVLKGEPLPEVSEEEIKIIEAQEKDFFELLYFFMDLEKNKIEFDLMMGDIKKWRAEEKLKAQEKLPSTAKKLFEICKTGQAVFDSEKYIRSHCTGYNSVIVLRQIESMLYYLS